jgi:hypothetical protein
MSHRAAFLQAVEKRLGFPVLWGQKGPDAFDCSGLVTRSLLDVGGPDLTQLENAQALHDHTRALGAEPSDIQLPGDLVFYGLYEAVAPSPENLAPEPRLHVIHVAICDEFGGVVSADGATSAIKSLSVALANPANRVRRHNTIRFRRDTPYVVCHRNTLVDQLDQVSR